MNEDVTMSEYFENFCKKDPLVYNHNRHTRITTIDPGTGLIAIDPATRQPTGAWNPATRQPGPAAPQDIPAFISYFAGPTSIQAQVLDALSYIWNPDDTGEVCYKYKMPSVLFTQLGGQVDIVNPVPGINVGTGPSTQVNRFTKDGGVITTGTNVYPGGKDYTNLAYIGQLRDTIVMGFFNKHNFNSYFTFPNFLLGEMLYMSINPKTGVIYTQATHVFRLFSDSSSQNELEFWVKHYGTGDGSFPYDKTKYVLPSGWKMIERADGIIMYLSQENQLFSDPPDGSYYIKKTDVNILTVIKSSVAHNLMVNEVNNAIRNGHGAGRVGQYGLADMGTPEVQNKLKLVAYMKNIEYLKQQYSLAGGGNKKKTKRKNIIKHVAKSKKKHNHK